MASGVFDLYCQDTTPGANSTFAPPGGWMGEQENYLKLIRYRYSRDIQFRQQMDVLAYRLSKAAQSTQRAEVSYSGPFAEQAKQIVQRLVEENRKYTVVPETPKSRAVER